MLFSEQIRNIPIPQPTSAEPGKVQTWYNISSNPDSLKTPPCRSAEHHFTRSFAVEKQLFGYLTKNQILNFQEYVKSHLYYFGRNENWVSQFFLWEKRIPVNSEEVSSIKSITGTEHNFTVEENGEDVQYNLTTGLNINGVAVNLYRDGNPVIESPTGGKFGSWLIVIFAVLIGALLGNALLN